MARKWQDQIPVLNEYQYTSDPNFKNFPLGTEYSHNYSHEKESYLVIADSVSQYAVSFKAFIKDFSISFKFDEEEEKTTDGKSKVVKSMSSTYNLNIDIPALSVDDAIINSARVDALNIMLEPYRNKKKDDENGRQTFNLKDNPQLILLSNLIHNGKYNKQTVIRDYKTLETYAARGYITKIDFKVNTEMGFFEYTSTSGEGIKLWPKVYETSLTIDIKMTNDDKYYSQPFNADGSLSANEFAPSGSWPFGVNTK